MGATTFETRACGKTAAEAFKNAVADARDAYGNSGYSGSIAEKRSHVVLTPPKGVEPLAYARSEEALNRVDDKWGPAGCVALGKGEWVFFGWAST